MHLDRRTALRVLAGLAVPALVGPLAGCGLPYDGRRLTIAAGVGAGVYYRLGGTLAAIWSEQLGATPEVLTTAGSVDNLDRLAAGTADVAFSQVDTAAERLAVDAPGDPRSPRALARIYDDAVHVVVRRDSPARRLVDLRGLAVAVGTPISGYYEIARRLLRTAGIDPDHGVEVRQLGLADSIAALRDGTVDAFFWSGGLPTSGITDLAAALPIRLLDLTDVLEDVRKAYPVYSPGTVPASAYGIGEPVATLFVRNFLLVPAGTDDDLAAALVQTMFAGQARLAAASPAALTIDARSAIGTQPVPLHPGAERFYRAGKVA
ncbi:TAXI family TRAP transporter solute-binding subunit [Pseudonocardia sp. WMMC193]|uniref:TAXI family TRAP transporter solute-binding subunit n=1 Tax=Pseudonocardia sp. WMMC193 TaxID=2911965 RepID=UPI001F029B3A|nr:TAXI family TRAP transporter solute-binding subunit [Pseudonocardia sp. WMMC193]MCF7549994.1 TAXI family TRAP transporter solute-binding subunit [Pseudonocardia sp. WMMC193]